jgi:hypothetical protein
LFFGGRFENVKTLFFFQNQATVAQCNQLKIESINGCKHPSTKSPAINGGPFTASGLAV